MVCVNTVVFSRSNYIRRYILIVSIIAAVCILWAVTFSRQQSDDFVAVWLFLTIGVIFSSKKANSIWFLLAISLSHLFYGGIIYWLISFIDK